MNDICWKAITICSKKWLTITNCSCRKRKERSNFCQTRNSIMWKPTLFLCGTKDVALGGLKQMQAAVTGSQLVELEGAGHLSNLEQPETWNAEVSGFLREEAG